MNVSEYFQSCMILWLDLIFLSKGGILGLGLVLLRRRGSILDDTEKPRESKVY